MTIRNWMHNAFSNKRNIVIVAIIALVIALAVAASIKNRPEGAQSLVEGCQSGDKFSQTTGEPCFAPCEGEGDIYNRDTGEPCNSESPQSE